MWGEEPDTPVGDGLDDFDGLDPQDFSVLPLHDAVLPRGT
jgi:hypothetical protein